MRRSVTSLLLAWAVGSAALAAQSQAARPNAIGFGFAATLGPGWQIEGGDVAFVRRTDGAVIGAFSGGVRIGTFVDEGAILGGSRGFVFAATVGARTRTTSLAQLGEELDPTTIGFDVTVEASGYFASSSPLPQGSRWAAVALLPGLRAGSGDGLRYAFVIGPTAFLGSGKSSIRGLLGFRIEAPLARRERRP